MTVAAGAPGKKRNEGGGERLPDRMGPKLLNAGTDPTLQYPVIGISSESVVMLYGVSNGWFEVSRGRVRYIVVKPHKKEAEGFDLPLLDIQKSLDVWQAPRGRGLVLHFSKKMGVKSETFIYLPEDRWGRVHHPIAFEHASEDEAAGTKSLLDAIRSFDSVLAMILTEPVRNGDLAKVEALLKDNPDLPSYRDESGGTLLHVAAAAGRGEMAKWLVEKGADVSAKDKAGDTPLHEAAKEGVKEVAGLLLDRGADPGARDNSGDTPLHFAASAGRGDMAKWSVEKGADVSAKDKAGHTPLYSARDHLDVAKLLCEHLASSGQLFEAADKGELELAEGLLKADPNLVFGRDDRGKTPLHRAASGGHRDLVEQILANQAEVDATDGDGATPLHLAAAGGHEDVAQLLIAHGGDAIARSGDGSTLSALAAKNGRTELVEFLRQQEAAAAAQVINAASALLGVANTLMLGNQVPRGVRALTTDARPTTYLTPNGQASGAGVEFVSPSAQDLFVSQQHPARLRLVAPALPIADSLPAMHAFVRASPGLGNSQAGIKAANLTLLRSTTGLSPSKEDRNSEIDGDIKGEWEASGNGQLLFAGGADSAGKWYLNEGELQFRGGVAVGRHLIVFTNGEIVSTSQWASSCAEGTVAKVDGVDYELTGQVWKPKN